MSIDTAIFYTEHSVGNFVKPSDSFALEEQVEQKVPYEYVTESGETYHVDAVSWKGSVKVETGEATVLSWNP